jgi:hypothetical protein
MIAATQDSKYNGIPSPCNDVIAVASARVSRPPVKAKHRHKRVKKNEDGLVTYVQNPIFIIIVVHFRLSVIRLEGK